MYNQLGLGKNRDQKKEKQRNKGSKGKTIYSSKRVRAYLSLLEKGALQKSKKQAKEKKEKKSKGKNKKGGSQRVPSYIFF